MEDTLRVYDIFREKKIESLNPCFNGRYSQSITRTKEPQNLNGLNPCFNGRYSQSIIFQLVLMSLNMS